jgi:hypothetical protein
VLTGFEADLRTALRGPDPRPTNLDPPASERHLPVLVAIPDSGAIRVPLALRSHNLVDLLLQHLGQNAQPDADRQRQQSFFRCPNQLAQCLLHALGQHGLIIGRPRDRYGLIDGRSSFGLARSTRHALTSSGRAGGTAVTSKLVRKSRSGCDRTVCR